MPDIPFVGRVIYGVTALVGLTILSLMAGSRIESLKEAFYRRPGFLHFIVFAIYFDGLVFLFATNLMFAGWPANEPYVCRASTYLCLSCYITMKTLVYLYLVYCTHVSRKEFACHKLTFRNDYICMVSSVLVISSIAVVYAFAFLHPIAVIESNQLCHVGLPPSVTIALLCQDLGLNIGLTFMLYYLTSKAMRKGSGLTFSLALHALPFRDPGPLVESLIGLPPAQFKSATKDGDKRLRLAKSLWGTIAVIMATAGNLSVLIYMKGHEQGWLCISSCIADALWSVVVIHWLTNGTGTIRLQSQIERSKALADAGYPDLVMVR
ncbi:MAG: hypothetical protein Q9209_002270 [Squamulea sp. 1 TL-2023]